MNRTGSTFTPVPPTRKKGARAIVTSSPRKSAAVRRLTTFQVTLPWVRITPFGRPVVPEVCGSRHTSSSVTSSSIAWPGDPATSASKSAAAPSSELVTVTPRQLEPRPPAARCRMTILGLMSSRIQLISASPSRWLTGARAAPSWPAANSDSRNAGWFGPSHATRSPLATPSARRPLASRLTRPASSEYVSRRSPAIRATPSGATLAQRSTHEPTLVFPTALMAVMADSLQPPGARRGSRSSGLPHHCARPARPGLGGNMENTWRRRGGRAR
jgi:hypothetical protein